MIDTRRSVVLAGTGDFQRSTSEHSARRSAIRYGTALAGIATAMALASPATAADECGVLLGGGGTVTCSDVDNPFPNGITYVTPTDPITLILGNTIVVDTVGAVLEGVDIDGGTGAANVQHDGSITTAGSNSHGIAVSTTTGTISVAGSGDITTMGDSAEAVDADSASGPITIDLSGAISTMGGGATGIYASSGPGAVTVSAADITTVGDGAGGIFANSGAGAVDVTATGAISTMGMASVGVLRRRAALAMPPLPSIT